MFMFNNDNLKYRNLLGRISGGEGLSIDINHGLLSGTRVVEESISSVTYNYLRLTQKTCFSSPYFLRTGSRHFSNPSMVVWPVPKMGNPGNWKQCRSHNMFTSAISKDTRWWREWRPYPSEVGSTLSPWSSFSKSVNAFEGIGHGLEVSQGGHHLETLLSITDDTDDTDNDHWILTQVQLRTQPTTNSWQAHEKARLRLCHSLIRIIYKTQAQVNDWTIQGQCQNMSIIEIRK